MRKLLLLIAGSALAASAACASAQAKGPVDRPNLEVPPVPPRVIESTPAQELPPPEPVGELPPAAPAAPRPRPPAPARDPVKTEPKPPETPPVEQPATSTAPVVPPVSQLRTPETVDGAEASRRVRDLIDRAKKTLALIDYRRLSTERRSQYDSAKLMITQSENELKASNFEFARNLADKADRIATELQTR